MINFVVEESSLLAKMKGDVYTGQFATTIVSAAQCCNIDATLI